METTAAPAETPHAAFGEMDRYSGFLRFSGAVVIGVLSGFLLLMSMQTGAAISLTGAGAPDWTWIEWDNHWAWRAVCSIAATAAAGFLAGLAARSRGRVIGAVASVPTALFWLLVTIVGVQGRFPGSTEAMSIPPGYRIIAALLLVASIPVGAQFGREGAAFGRANARHYDSRRAALFGIRFYHYLWLPILLHMMVLTAAFGSMYGFQWVVRAFASGYSLLSFIPFLFVFAMVATLQLLATGAMTAYEALAGFTDGTRADVTRSVLKHGVGYTLATLAAQLGVALVHAGLGILVEKISG